ncbi:hypothetical protein NLJ89_g3224 [Agrocybe chaxingu]|uniref:CAP-Gly domain-containing protein n=1 Tax=Agrocybe chaxingu TaxID=84603 RepID=A0A9W8K4F0_9AGAR|nr:hypothetical protein NLJ89_g3224 [Agrocybe chaxingu]
MMIFASGFALALLAARVAAFPVLEARQGISTLTAAQVAAVKPYSYYAAAAYCVPARTRAWDCGTNCQNNAAFRPIASGGDGGVVQYCIPVLTNADFRLDALDSGLFPGVSSSVRTHNGFGEAQKRSAAAVLAAVRSGLSTHSATSVTVVGHSLGGAIAIISSAHLANNLPAGTIIKTYTFGTPRVGNEAFANYANARSELIRVNNKKDPVPIIPGRFLGFAHTEGEIHINDAGQWISCPGQDNTNSQCTIGAVPNILVSNSGDHSVNVFVVSPDTHSERRIDPHITVEQLKGKLELITGIPVSHQALSLLASQQDSRVLAELSDDSKPLGFYGLADWQVIKVTDTNPSDTLTGQLTDVSQVEKFEISEAEYAQRNDTVLAYKQRHKIGRFAGKVEEKQGDQSEMNVNIPVGSRCEVESTEPGLSKRGTVRFVGPTKFSKGVWVGVEYDEPFGKNDGSVHDERYFFCRQNYGIFVKLDKVKVGDFPVQELDLEDEEM